VCERTVFADRYSSSAISRAVVCGKQSQDLQLCRARRGEHLAAAGASHGLDDLRLDLALRDLVTAAQQGRVSSRRAMPAMVAIA
jgi:hypothetical protein